MWRLVTGARYTLTCDRYQIKMFTLTREHQHETTVSLSFSYFSYRFIVSLFHCFLENYNGPLSKEPNGCLQESVPRSRLRRGRRTWRAAPSSPPALGTSPLCCPTPPSPPWSSWWAKSTPSSAGQCAGAWQSSVGFSGWVSWMDVNMDRRLPAARPLETLP